MAGHAVPHFANDAGVPVIHIGAHEFMCIGATPPFDHPHVYLDLGSEHEIVCPYCSTLFKIREGLGAEESDPPGALWRTPAPA